MRFMYGDYQMNDSKRLELMVVNVLKAENNQTIEAIADKLRVSKALVNSLCGQLAYKGIITKVRTSTGVECKLTSKYESYYFNNQITNTNQVTTNQFNAESPNILTDIPIGIDAETLKDPVKILKWLEEKKALEDAEKEYKLRIEQAIKDIIITSNGIKSKLDSANDIMRHKIFLENFINNYADILESLKKLEQEACNL